jgi:hypothetical protein
MLRKLFAAVLMLGLFAGGLLAAEGTVVSYDKKTAKLVVKVDGKNRTIQLKGFKHIHYPDGKHVKFKDLPKVLKKGLKVDLEEDEGKVTEINIKK